MNPEVLERLEKCKSLPTLPGVAVQILELCEKEDVVMAEMATTIGQDPALSARVLQIVNSAGYGLQRQVETLDHALALLGINAVRTVALSFSMVRGLRKTDSQGFDLSKFWCRSLIAGVAAKNLSQWAKLLNEDALFLGSLLQDIGMMALGSAFPQPYQTLITESGGDHQRIAELEKKEFGGDHAEVSSWLAQHWNLPKLFELCLRGSHDPSDSDAEPELLPSVKIVAVSGLIADIWAGGNPTTSTKRARDAASGMLDIDDQSFQDILGSVASLLPQISSLFEINIGDPDSINEILERAKESLVRVSMASIENAQLVQSNADQLESKNQELKEKSARDGLTGLYNRAHLSRTLKSEFARSKEEGTPLGVVFCDIDHFKQINDTHGHQAGDQILVSVAKTLMDQVRQSDVVARYGGEEFVFVLPGADVVNVAQICHRVLRVIASQSHAIGPGKSIQITISIGYAIQSEQTPFESMDSLLHAADEALYVAKRQGRNRVEFYSKDQESKVADSPKASAEGASADSGSPHLSAN